MLQPLKHAGSILLQWAGQRGFLCVQYKVKGCIKCTETSVCADLQQQLHLTLHSHHLTKHIYDVLR